MAGLVDVKIGFKVGSKERRRGLGVKLPDCEYKSVGSNPQREDFCLRLFFVCLIFIYFY